MQHDYDPIGVLSSCFAVASLCGIAVLLRSGRTLTLRNVLSAFLWNGLAGLITALVLLTYFGDKYPWLIIGVSGLTGMGTISLVDVTTISLRLLGDVLSGKKSTKGDEEE